MASPAPTLPATPTSFFIARILTLFLLCVILIAIAAFNAYRYQTAPILIRQSTVDTVLTPPAMAISVYDRKQGDVANVRCSRATRNVNAAGGADQGNVPLKIGATYGTDFTAEAYVDPPFNPAIVYLTKVDDMSMIRGWKPFDAATAKTDAYDLYLTCEVNITNPAPSSPYFILGEVAFERVVGVDHVASTTRIPRFSTVDAIVILAHQQYLNVILTVTKYCTLAGVCEFRREIGFSQTSQMPPATNATAAGRNLFTVQFRNQPGVTPGTFRVDVMEEVKSYSLLEVASSVFSAVSILILVYAWLMGQNKLDTLGVIQRYVLRKDTEAYVEKVKHAGRAVAANKGDGSGDGEAEALQCLLYGVYLEAPTRGEIRRRKRSEDTEKGITTFIEDTYCYRASDASDAELTHAKGIQPDSSVVTTRTMLPGDETGMKYGAMNSTSTKEHRREAPEVLVTAPWPNDHESHSDVGRSFAPSPMSSLPPVRTPDTNQSGGASPVFSAHQYPRPPLPDLNGGRSPNPEEMRKYWRAPPAPPHAHPR